MALDPEIQRIILRDGPAVLGDPSQWPSQTACIRNMTATLEKLIEEGTIRAIDPSATAHILNGTMLYASLLIANAEDQRQTSQEAVRTMTLMLDGLLAMPKVS